jgi:hypothetical protein
MSKKQAAKQEAKQEARQEAKQIAQRMADQGKSAAQIQNRIENKTSVSASAAQNIVARVAPPSSPARSSSSTSRPSSDNNKKAGSSIAGVQIGNKLNAGEVQKLLDKGLTLQQIQNRAGNKDINLASGAKTLFKPADPTATETPDTTTTTTTDDGDSYYENQIPYSEYDLFGETFSAQIQNQGLENVERIRQAGATERLKYEVDNRIPEIQAESKGKLDLQAIVNAGYKNIANIERGTEMVRNVTSMFNF